MIAIPGYTIEEQIHENARLRVFRGHMVGDRKPVIIKALKAEAVTPVNISKRIFEYEITRNLDIEGIIKPLRVERAGEAPALVMEDVGAISLRQYRQANFPDLSTFLSIAVQLVETLGGLHGKNIIHGDLKPDNIVIHPGTRRVWIIDFSMAALLTGAGQNALASNTPAGTPAYMSPEQTGRMNRAVDSRSDFYSLGVVFYEMLTGQLPFQVQVDNLDRWVYTHIAEKPVFPGEIGPDIPQTISEIIMKLLSKNAEERYQSASGLLWDLKESQRQWSQTGVINSFTPGLMDLPGRFQLPRKLYGREKEIEALTAVFERVCSGKAELVLVNGYAGVGKTVLVNETLKPFVTKKGYFIAGKFDQLQQNQPYAPFIQAFKGLIRQILTEHPESLAAWRKRLLRALGRNGAVITGFIPEVELIIGPQPPVEALQPKGAQNRFRMVFRNFIRVFAKKDHPLVIFLDDLQWSDPASLQLIRYLIDDPDSRYLLLVGAYRDNEVTGTHPLMTTLTELEKAGKAVRYIPLEPLNLVDTGKFIADTLHITEEKAYPLAEILYRKTAGNPLFLGQLLQSVYDEKFLTYNAGKGCWEWKLTSIEKLKMTDDVVHLMMERMQKLPENSRNILKLAACIGNIFDLKTLSMIYEKTPDQTAADLWPAVLAGIVLVVDETAKFSQTSNQSGATVPITGSKAAYEFLHDRVRQVAYSLLPEERKKEIHLKVGRLILQSTGRDELDEKLFVLMDHLNLGLDLIPDQAERIKLSEYNLMAGKKAKDSTAYTSALNYLKAGMEFLPDNSWNEYYRLTYNLYLERSQCEYLCAHFDEAERIFDLLLARAKTDLERAGVYGLKMVLNSGMGNYPDAAQLGMTALKQLGIKLPSNFGKIAFVKEIILSKWLLRSKKIKDLFNLPEMSDPVQRKALEIIILLTPPANKTNPEMFAFLCLKSATLSMKYGNTDFSSIGYAGFSIFTGSVLGDYAKGREFEQLAVKLSEKYNNSSAKCIVYFVIGAFVNHWTEHGKNGVGYLKKAIHYGLESGDLLFAGYALTCIIKNKYLLGIGLEEIYEECQGCYNFAKHMKLETLLINIMIYRQFVLNLKGLTGDPFTLTNEDYDEKSFVDQKLKSDNMLVLTYYFFKLQLYYLFGDYENALAVADKAQKDMFLIMGYLLSAEHNFYYSLAITAMYDRLNEKAKKKYWKILKKNQRQMKKWSNYCAENFLHKYLLVAAEMVRLRGKEHKAFSLYDRSISSARENGYTQNEALASELAARYYLAKRQDKMARIYMTDACHGYYRWGAAAKARSLREQYPHLLAGIVVQEESFDPAEVMKSTFPVSTASDSGSSDDLDLGAIRKAAQNISEETDPEQIIKKFLEIAVENAGADKGYLLLEKDGNLFIEAAKETGEHQAIDVTPISLENGINLPATVVRYVARTNEPVVLNDGEQPGLFARDPYITQYRPKSILCLPVILQGIPAGVLYLENTQTSGVFSPERLEVLRLLSTQMVYVRKLHSFLGEDPDGIKHQSLQPVVEPLTERELEVLNLIAAGLSNKEIAQRLGMTENTVKTHNRNIFGKLGVNRRIQAVARAKKLKLL